jgi:hypothetical protein
MDSIDFILDKAGIRKQAAEKELDITNLLSIAANIKAIHVKTKRYSQHMALDEAFEDLNETMDAFNECVQGYYLRKEGKRLNLKNATISFKLPDDDKVFEAIKSLEIEFRKAAAKVTDGDSALGSVRDDVLNCFYQLYYRLDLKG